MAKQFNRVAHDTATTGTGAITLGSAVAKHQTFAAAGISDGDVVSYLIEDGSDWEYGHGTYTAAGTALARTTILGSSNSGSEIDLSGSAVVYCDVLAEDLADAIHDNAAGEINALSEKETPVDDDLLIIEDSEASYAKKKVLMSNLPSGGGNSIYTDAYASRPAASNDGDLFLPSDGFTVQRDTGTAWVPWGPIYPFTTPVLGDFTWNNQGGATAVASKNGVYIYEATSSGTGLRLLDKNAPSTPYTITIAFLMINKMITNEMAGLAFRQSTDNKCQNFGLLFNSTINNIRTATHKYSNLTTWNASYSESAASTYPRGIVFLRIADDGTSRICSISADGQNFITFHSVGRTDYLTADKVGFFIAMNGSGSTVGMTLLSWKEA